MATMTAAKAKTIRDPGKYRADQTLYLRVKPSGGKTWVQRLTIHGKRRDIGLGPFDLVTLAEARMKAWENRRAVFEGRGPAGREAAGEGPYLPGSCGPDAGRAALSVAEREARGAVDSDPRDIRIPDPRGPAD